MAEYEPLTVVDYALLGVTSLHQASFASGEKQCFAGLASVATAGGWPSVCLSGVLCVRERPKKREMTTIKNPRQAGVRTAIVVASPQIFQLHPLAAGTARVQGATPSARKWVGLRGDKRLLGGLGWW